MKSNNLAPAPSVKEVRLPHREDLLVFEGGFTLYRHELGNPSGTELPRTVQQVIHYHTRGWWLTVDKMGHQPSLANRFELESMPMPYEAATPAAQLPKLQAPKTKWSLKMSQVLWFMVAIAAISLAWVMTQNFAEALSVLLT